jgi:protein-export membrane protein SecD
MRKSTIWQSIVSVLVMILAVLIVLNIKHPDWAKNLLVWQPEGQREIAWHYGVDIADNQRILLAPDMPEGEKPDAAQMQAALGVVRSRAKSLSLTKPVVELLEDDRIAVQVPNPQDLAVVTQTLQAPGLIEFIDAGTQYPATQIVETTLSEPQPPVTPTAGITPTQTVTPTVYETLMTNNDLEYIELQPPSQGYYSAKFRFNPSGQEALLGFNQNHPGDYICITLDKRVLTCALSSQLMKTDLAGNAEYPIIIEEGAAQATSALFRSGMLPASLRVNATEPAAPTLGEKTVQQLGIAAIIALAIALVFVLVLYRLPGLLAVLALVVFTLLSLALCRIMPLPITLTTIAGLGATSLTTLGALLSAAERLRQRVRADWTLPRAVEASFSNAWPSILNTHLALGLLGIATWIVAAIVAAQTIRWLGLSLITGTLVSLFATMVFDRTLTRLIAGIGAVQAWVGEQEWTLGI